MQGISNSRPPANFQYTTDALNSNFRIRRNVYLSRHNLKPPQQLDISFIDCEISFIRIADFFCILYLPLKKLQIYGFDPTYLLKPILQNLSSRTYPPEPI